MRDLQSRFELAVEDVRSLKRRNAELEDQLAALKASRGELPLSQAQDWESVKQRMLAELEPDANLNEEQKEERASIENTIRITDQIVADKDREIAELQQLLTNQSDSLGSFAVARRRWRRSSTRTRRFARSENDSRKRRTNGGKSCARQKSIYRSSAPFGAGTRRAGRTAARVRSGKIATPHRY